MFPIAEYWWFYAVFTAAVVALLAGDLFLHRKQRSVSMRDAAIWTAVWVALALLFAGGLHWFVAGRFGAAAASRLTLEFLAGYIVEESLSVDNMFVFAVIFRYFAVPGHLQHGVLFYGVLGAMVFRGIFIAMGSALVQFHWAMVLFGIFLIYTGIKLLRENDAPKDPGSGLVMRLARRWLRVTPDFHGHRFLVRLDGALFATPLLVVLLVLETTDIVFAVDSVPAVFGVTKEPLIVFTSNVFAILGLRSLYFLLAGAIDKFHALRYGLAAVLIFVGLKMAWLEVGIGISLAVICLLLGASVAVSLLFPAGLPRVDRASLVRWFTGVVCLGLAGLNGLAAFGPALEWPILTSAVELELEWLVVSGLAYGVGGVLLLRGAGEKG